MQKRLSTSEFSIALKRGQGRALLHIHQFGLDEVADILLESCLKNPSYDPPCEPSRAKWLFGMFQHAPQYAYFSSTILSALACETESYDLEQLCELAAQMGKHGDAAAVMALRAPGWLCTA